MVFFFIIFLVERAHGHDAQRPDLDNWYSQLRSHTDSPCCDGSDFGKGTAAHLEPQDWATQDKPNSHYKVFLEGVWVDVPDTALVDVPNKDGRALVWFYTTWIEQIGKPTIRCFMPGTMT